MTKGDTRRHYTSIAAFRIALEQRLNKQANDEGINVMRLRRTVAFDRFLARLFHRADAPWILKGGYANELRLQGHARSTKDIDLSIPRQSTGSLGISALGPALHDLLQAATDVDLGDWFRFRISAPMLDLDGPPEGGTRFHVAAVLDRPFTEFHIDVGLGDLFSPPAEQLRGHDLLGFAGIAPPRVRAVRANRQFAVALRDQGMNEEAAHFDYRAQVCQRMVYELQGRRFVGPWLFSGFLDALAGYGYRPARTLLWYLAVIGGFALVYFAAAQGLLTFGLPPSQYHALPWYEALILSVSAFHGRGFFQPLESPGDPVAILAAAEAVIGLFIEISFIATFTQRFFGTK